MAKSKIEWTDRVWNPVTGCTKVSQGCKNCYAETIANRFWGDRKFTDVRCHEDRLEQPLHIKKPSMIFINSMSDLFHAKVSFEFIYEVINTIEFSPQHIFQILTKRPERALEFAHWYREKRKGCPLPRNIWLGVSVEDQETANERIPILLQVPAAVRWLSIEPMLGKINITHFLSGWKDEYDNHFLPIEIYNIIKNNNKIDWVVVGGESGAHARPMHPEWVRSIRDQCKEYDIPFFFKQWGEWLPGERIGTSYKRCDNGEIYGSNRDYERDNFGTNPDKYSGDLITLRIGKKKAGSLLDGKECKEYPEVK